MANAMPAPSSATHRSRAKRRPAANHTASMPQHCVQNNQQHAPIQSHNKHNCSDASPGFDDKPRTLTRHRGTSSMGFLSPDARA